MPAIITCIKGGLGNQLFCYAAARRLALANNAVLIIDDITGFERDIQYQRRYMLDHFNISARKATPAERMEPLGRYRRFIVKWLSRHKPFMCRPYLKQEGMDFDERLLALQVRRKLYLDGYWQGEGYFKDVEQTIRTDLQITPPVDATNLSMAARVRDSLAVAVHVRFFDAPNEIGINNAPGDYYAHAVTKMETLVPGAHYFVFSDRPDAARVRIPLTDDRITCVAHNRGGANAYADLWLMTLCKHFIIANSTFSWWGAWLAPHACKQVIAPGFEMREGKMWWGFDGLIPDGWIKC